jgi:hypothetical protein
MYVVREIMHCKPGKVRPMVEKFQALNKLIKESGASGMSNMRLMTDVSAERFWTIVAETDVANLEEHEQATRKMMADPRFQEVMKGYHDLVEDGRREIYTLEK